MTRRRSFLLAVLLLLAVLSATGVQAQDRLVAADNRFAFKLLSVLAPDSANNLIVAPPGLAMALGMVYCGAAESTALELSRVLELGEMTPKDVSADYEQLRSQMKNLDRNVEILNANSFWVRKDIPLSAGYSQAMDNSYSAKIKAVALGKSEADKDINAWAARMTKDKVLAIVDQTDPAAYSYLLNAFCFKGLWQQAFDPWLTRMDTFTPHNYVYRNVMMMNRTGQYKYFHGDGFQAVELPYGDGRVCMDVFLPDAASSLREFLDNLNSDNWNQWLPQFRSANGAIGLPKMQMTATMPLNRALQTLGLDLTFDPKWADFTNMLSVDTFFAVGPVRQAVTFDISEEGTGAATPVPGLAAIPGFTMIMDQPFFFVIRDNQTGLILFAGVIRDPV